MAFRKHRSNKIYDEHSLHEYALGALSRKMRTVAELKRLMRQRVGKQDDGDRLIEQVVFRLKEQKLLNDAAYAGAYSNYRKDNEKFGRMRVVQDLKVKGVHPDVIEKAVGATYEGVNEQELVRQFLARKRVKQPQDQKQTARIFRMLARAGFSTRSAIAVLKNWNVDDETLSSLEQERADAEEQQEDLD